MSDRACLGGDDQTTGLWLSRSRFRNDPDIDVAETHVVSWNLPFPRCGIKSDWTAPIFVEDSGPTTIRAGLHMRQFHAKHDIVIVATIIRSDEVVVSVIFQGECGQVGNAP